jgi:hypothetical protein
MYCGEHTVEIRAMGGVTVLWDLTPLMLVRWRRLRDDVSTAEVWVPSGLCCDIIAELRTVIHELHIYRNGEAVWQGPITRITIDNDRTEIFAEDILWVCKKKVLQSGYDQAHPNIWNVLDRMDWLLREHCYECDGDPWNMVSPGTDHLHLVTPTLPGPKTSRAVAAYQFTTWEDFDKYAEDSGADYTVIGRDIYFWDIDHQWLTIPDLDEDFLDQFPRIVEYGNQLFTYVFVSNAKGYASRARANSTQRGIYGSIEQLISNVQDAGVVEETIPAAQDLAEWYDTARRHVTAPAPVAVVIPANTSLLPRDGSGVPNPWEMGHLVPGAWFEVTVTRMCRTVTQLQRLHEIIVEEVPETGETIKFTAISAPQTDT